jgi:RNA polymerase sigma-70 factor (ECF subfamily)
MIVAVASQKMLPQDAEDIAEETIVAAWFKARQFDSARASLKTWMVAIARRRMIDAWRRSRCRIKGLPIEIAESVPVADRVRDDRSPRLALSRMSSIQRDRFGMLARGVSYGAMSKMENVPLGTIKSSLNGGRKRAGVFKKGAQ